MIEHVVEGVQWIQGKDSFLPDSHVYVIGKSGSSDFTLVDCGLMDMGSYKLEQLESAGISPNQVKRIIMTHTHLDHIGCLPELLRGLPDAEVWVHEDEASYLEAGDARIIFGNSMFESMVKSQYAIPQDCFRIKVQRKLVGEEMLDLGGIAFKVIHLPGHSAGGIGLFSLEHKLLISGDTIYADGAIGRYDLFSANPSELKRSLELVAGLGIDILLPCHNRIVKGGAEPMINKTVVDWSGFLGN
ncbi:MAG: MBL fold metallo-hydrolase [Desulfomonile sp.]